MPSITLEQTTTLTSHTHTYTLHYTTLGSPTSPPIIFIHGTPWSHKYWIPYAHAFSSSFRVYLFDNPGYRVSPGGKPISSSASTSETGDNQLDSLDASLSGQAEAFSLLFKHWKETDDWKEKLHVIAHDFGGLISLRANLLHACDHSFLCLIDPVALSDFGSPFFRLVSSNPSTSLSIPPSVLTNMVRGYITKASYHPLPSHIMDPFLHPWSEKGVQGPRGFIRQIIQADRGAAEEVEGRYAEVGEKMPVKIIWGREDGWIPVSQAGRLGEVIKAREVSVLEGAGHLVMVDREGALGVELGVWIERVTRG